MNHLTLFIVFLILAILAAKEIADSNKNNNNNNAVFVFTVSLLALFAGLRSLGYGSDDIAYFDIFTKVPDIFSCSDLICNYNYKDFNIEFGFFVYLILIGMLAKSYSLLFVGVALPSVYIKLKSMYLYTPFFSASVLIYFSHFYLAMELNAIRLGIASGLIFYLAKYLVARRFWPVAILFTASISMHISALFALLPIVLYALSAGPRFMIGLTVFVVVTSQYITVENIAIIFGGFDFLEDKTSSYVNYEGYSYAISLLDTVNSKNLLISSLCLLNFEKLRNKYKYFEIAAVFFMSATLLRIFLGDFAIVAGRSYAVFAMFDCILIPMLAITYLGRNLGGGVVIIYASVVLVLNALFNTSWSGDVSYFSAYF